MTIKKQNNDSNSFNFFNTKFQVKVPLANEQKVPKKIHFIWFGNTLTNPDYLRNIKSWKDLNPNHTVTLWVHSEQDIPAHLRELNDSRIEVKALSSIKQRLDNYDLTEHQISKANLHAASDITRVDLVASEGGVYSDVGNLASKPIEEAVPQNWACFFDYKPLESIIYGMTLGNYGLHAAVPDHDLYRLAQVVLREILKHDELTRYLDTDNPMVKHTLTVGLTGTAVFIARDILIQIRNKNDGIARPLATDTLSVPKKALPYPDNGHDLDNIRLFKSIFSNIIQGIKLDLTHRLIHENRRIDMLMKGNDSNKAGPDTIERKSQEPYIESLLSKLSGLLATPNIIQPLKNIEYPINEKPTGAMFK